MLWVTDRSIKCHELFVILYSILGSLSDDMFFCYCIFKTKNEFGQNPEENIILTGPGQYTKILTGSLTNTNKDNIIVKYNICKCNSQKYLIIPN
jgi:hypothetical protein